MHCIKTPNCLKNAPGMLSFVSIRSIILLIYFAFGTYAAMAQHGLLAEYYDGRNFNRLVSTRIESQIDLSWNQIPPVDGINPHDCSIRWRGKIRPAHSGQYTFSARVDDGIRIWVNDQLVINEWDLNDVGAFNGSIYLEKGQYYGLKVEYFNALIEGEITLMWDIPEQDSRWYRNWFKKGDYEVIKSEYFYQPVDVAEVQPQKSDSNSLLASKESSPPSRKENKPTVAGPRSVTKRKQIQTHKKVPSVISEVKPQERFINADTLEAYTPKHIRFERATTALMMESYRELDRFANFMLHNPELRVKIEGHTDPVGDESKNHLLSQRRAYTIARYLVKKGVKAGRIEAEGFGGSRPLVVPEDKTYHPENRRVDFIVRKQDF